MFSDPGKRQYLMFSAVLAIIFAGILSFFFADLLEGPFVSGFPINISDLSGIGKILAQIINTAALGAMLTVPMYYFLSWLNQRAGGGGF